MRSRSLIIIRWIRSNWLLWASSMTNAEKISCHSDCSCSVTYSSTSERTSKPMMSSRKRLLSYHTFTELRRMQTKARSKKATGTSPTEQSTRKRMTKSSYRNWTNKPRSKFRRPSHSEPCYTWCAFCLWSRPRSPSAWSWTSWSLSKLARLCSVPLETPFWEFVSVWSFFSLLKETLCKSL